MAHGVYDTNLLTTLTLTLIEANQTHTIIG